MSAPEKLGFLGLGQMGGPMAENIAAGGFSLRVFDPAGTKERAPKGSLIGESLSDVVSNVETVFLSLPDGKASCAVVTEIADCPTKTVSVVIDLSTIGPKAAQDAKAICEKAGITYIDAPVSGGAAGARARSITVMWAGPESEMQRHQAILDAFSKNQFHVGNEAGHGQTVKILNNFLSATSMAATSEAMLFGLSQGLDMKIMLDVVNVSSGQNTASRDKFPQQILTEAYAAGFKSALLAKDVKLYLDNVQAAGTPSDVGEMISKIWSECDAALPGSDFTRVFEFIRDRKAD